MQEEERIALIKGEFYPGSKQQIESPDELAAVPAYQKYYFALQGPLTSPSVKFSEKKSIIGDDDDD